MVQISIIFMLHFQASCQAVIVLDSARPRTPPALSVGSVPFAGIRTLLIPQLAVGSPSFLQLFYYYPCINVARSIFCLILIWGLQTGAWPKAWWGAGPDTERGRIDRDEMRWVVFEEKGGGRGKSWVRENHVPYQPQPVLEVRG